MRKLKKSYWVDFSPYPAPPTLLFPQKIFQEDMDNNHTGSDGIVEYTKLHAFLGGKDEKEGRVKITSRLQTWDTR